MPVFKCKMCGGDLVVEEGATVCKCEYCGSTQTIPTADNEKKVKLFDRANNLRLKCEFDKAESVYESIIDEFPEEAEGYWGDLLCKYGIEYVDDPNDGRKVPTCHRSSYDSIMDDPDFDMVMENADTVARSVYRAQAKQLEELRKNIVAVSANEKPYDIFICYKETAEDGNRTLDSVLAQDVYDALTERGYRVFFSRISLEDKLGTEYEPYIFAALNSAKIMLAFGTSYDNYNAVWVKNEWSRYLHLMAKEKTKHLIPCYKDIDAYDIPKEFSKLQGQDLGKVGAIQDLVRGIDKILGKDRSGADLNSVDDVKAGAEINAEANALLRRAKMYLEEKDWHKAVEYCEQVLDKEPENSQAYLLKGLALDECLNIDELAQIYYKNAQLQESTPLRYARRFANKETEALLSEFDQRKRDLLTEEKQRWEALRNKRENDPAAQQLRKKLKEVREKSNLVEARVYTTLCATYVLCEDGTIRGTTILNDEYGTYDNDQSQATQWRNIKIFRGSEGVTYDGRVLTISHKERSSIYDLSALNTWTDINRIYFNFDKLDKLGYYYGIKKDGTVVCACVGNDSAGDTKKDGRDDVSKLNNISEYLGNYFGRDIFLRNDGTLASTEYTGYDDRSCWDELSSWTNIVGLDTIPGRIIGKKKDGSLIATRYFDKGEDRSGWDKICRWTDIVCFHTFEERVIALNEYGELLDTSIPPIFTWEGMWEGRYTRDDLIWKEISKWKNIAKLYFTGGIVYGLTGDGILIATKYHGKSEYRDSDEDSLIGMENVIGFKPEYKFDVAIKNDGSLVAGGENDHGQCNVTNLKICDDVDKMIENLKIREKQEQQEYAYKQACQKIEDIIQAEIAKQSKPICEEYDLNIKKLNEKMNDEIVENEKKTAPIEEEITNLKREKTSLGLFRGKEKKKIQESIDALLKRLNTIGTTEDIRKKYKIQFDFLAKKQTENLAVMKEEIRAKYVMPKLEDFME